MVNVRVWSRYLGAALSVGLSVGSLPLLACGGDSPPPAPAPPPAAATQPRSIPSASSGGAPPFIGGYGAGTRPLPDVGGGGSGASGRQMIERRRREREARERAMPQRLTSEGSLTREAEVMRSAVTSTTPIYDDDDDTTCERAWVQFQAMQERYAAEMGGHTRTAPLDSDSRAAFLRECQALPRDQQQCMDTEYRRQHVADCQEFQEHRSTSGERVARGARRRDSSVITPPPEARRRRSDD